jgi:hypothetical protein
MGSKRVDHWTSGTVYYYGEIAGSLQGFPPSSRLCPLWSWKEDLQRALNRHRRPVWDQVGLLHCRHNGLGTVRDKAHLRQGHNEQSRGGHQCSETMLTGESPFHISTPLGMEPRSLMMGSKRVDHWTSGTVHYCSEIAGSPQFQHLFCPWLARRIIKYCN